MLALLDLEGPQISRSVLGERSTSGTSPLEFVSIPDRSTTEKDHRRNPVLLCDRQTDFHLIGDGSPDGSLVRDISELLGARCQDGRDALTDGQIIIAHHV